MLEEAPIVTKASTCPRRSESRTGDVSPMRIAEHDGSSAWRMDHGMTARSLWRGP